VSLSLNVTVPQSLHQDAGHEVYQGVERYLQEQMDRLQIPVSIVIGSALQPKVSTAPGRPDLTIDGRTTSFTVPAGAAFEIALALASFDSRELIVTTEVVDAVWRACFDGESCPAPLVEACRSLLRDAVRWGLRLDRIRSAVAQLRDEGSAADPAVLFERAVAGFVPRVALRAGMDLHDALFDPATGQPLLTDGDTDVLPALLATMQEGLFWELGIYLPPTEIIRDPALGPWELQVDLNDFSLPRENGLPDGAILVSLPPSSPILEDMGAVAATNPANGNDAALVAAEHAHALGDNPAATTWGKAGYAVLISSTAIRRHCGALVTAELASVYVTQMRRVFPRLADLLAERLEPAVLARMFRLMLDEEISIRDLRTIGDAILSVSAISSVDHLSRIVFQPESSIVYPMTAMADPKGLQAADYAEMARLGLRYYISHKFTRGQNTLMVYLIDPGFERRIAENRGALPDEDIAEFMVAARGEIGDAPRLGAFPVILTGLDVRRYVRRMIERDFPNVAVVSYQELQADMNIQPLGRITP
jgi:hypothetical protein